MPQKSARPPTDEQARAVEALRGGRRFVLAGHQKPDGDCLGAEAALARVLRALGKEVWIVNPDPTEPQFDFLARAARFEVYKGGDLPRADAVVVLDFSEITRCGPMEAAVRAHAGTKVVIDHHLPSGEPWWDLAYVDSTAAATGLLVLRIARQLGAPIDGQLGEAVFTSLVTDTGWFKYSNTDVETLSAAAELVAAGVDPARMFRTIFQRRPADEPLALAHALGRLEYFADGRLAVADLPRAAPGQPVLADSDVLLDILRAVESVEVVLFLREGANGTCKLSARSKGTADVHALARAFGGGGHAKAAGATIAGSLADVRARVVEAAVARFAAPARAAEA